VTPHTLLARAHLVLLWLGDKGDYPTVCWAFWSGSPLSGVSVRLSVSSSFLLYAAPTLSGVIAAFWLVPLPPLTKIFAALGPRYEVRPLSPCVFIFSPLSFFPDMALPITERTAFLVTLLLSISKPLLARWCSPATLSGPVFFTFGRVVLQSDPLGI